jgi:hypothetical protein
MRRPTLLVALACLVPLQAAAQPTPAGPEFAVSDGSVDSAPRTAVASDDRGDAVVVWSGDCGGEGICLRAYDPSGAPRGEAVRLDGLSALTGRSPVVALFPEGTVIVVSLASHGLFEPTTDVVGRRFALDGSPLGDLFVLYSGALRSDPGQPAIAALPGGGAAVVWAQTDRDRIQHGILGRLIEADGGGPGASLQVTESPVTDFVDSPAVAADASGDFIVTWETFPLSPTVRDVDARAFDHTAQPLGPPFTVHEEAVDGGSSDLDAPAVAATPDGGFMVAWESHTSGSVGIHARVVTPAGPSGAEVAVAATGLDATPVAAGSESGFAVAWRNAEATGGAVLVRSLTAAGTPVGAAQPLATSDAVDDALPGLAGDRAGDLFAVWTRSADPSHHQIFGRRLTAPPPGTCAASPTALCLAGGRFRVEVAWYDQHNGGSGLGTAVPDNDTTGLFWFFNAANVELAVKVLDGRPVNDHFWVFYGALSDVRYTLTVTDVETGERRFYDNAAGSICGRGDTAAFPLPASGSSGAAAAPGELLALPLPAPGEGIGGLVAAAPDAGGAATCAADDQHLCLLGDRFRVSVVWHDQHNGGDGVGHALPFADKTGFFWFFNPVNLELAVKVLDGRPINGYFWVFYGALSDVDYTLTVTDTEGGGEATYHNLPGNLCGRGDTSAL